MKFTKGLLCLVISIWASIPSHSMERDSDEVPSKVRTQLSSIDALETESYEQDPPLCYLTTSHTLYIAKLIDSDVLNQDSPNNKEEQKYEQARIDYTLTKIEGITPKNDVENFVFLSCLFTTKSCLQRIFDLCFSKDVKRFKHVKSITFKDVVFSDVALKVVVSFRESFVSGFLNKLHKNKIEFINCGILESASESVEIETISQESYQKAQETRKQILATFAKYLPSQTASAPRDRQLRAFAALWETSPKEIMISPRMVTTTEDKHSHAVADDAEEKSLDIAHHVKQQILMRYTKDLISQSPPKDTTVRAFAELRRETSQEVPASHLIAAPSEEEHSLPQLNEHNSDEESTLG